MTLFFLLFLSLISNKNSVCYFEMIYQFHMLIFSSIQKLRMNCFTQKRRSDRNGCCDCYVRKKHLAVTSL